jgi:hypothetical protein
VEEQIFEQVKELRMDIENLRMEMNDRFDTIDRKLNAVYDVLVVGFAEINTNINRVGEDVRIVQLGIAEIRSELRGLEARMIDLFQSQQLQALREQINLALGYRDRNNGIDMPFNGAPDSYVVSQSLFHQFATVEAFTQPSVVPPGATLNMASETLSEPLDRTLNALNTLASQLPGFGQPLVSGTLPNPTVWSQAGDAYAQVAEENPWYFAAVNQNEIQQVLEVGTRVPGIVEATRNPAYIDELEQFYAERAADLNAASATTEFNFLVDQMMPTDLDMWGSTTQTLTMGGQPDPFYGSIPFFPAAGPPHNLLVPLNIQMGYERFPSLLMAHKMGLVDLSTPASSAPYWHRNYEPPPPPGGVVTRFIVIHQDLGAAGFIALRLEVDRAEQSFGGPWVGTGSGLDWNQLIDDLLFTPVHATNNLESLRVIFDQMVHDPNWLPSPGEFEFEGLANRWRCIGGTCGYLLAAVRIDFGNLTVFRGDWSGVVEQELERLRADFGPYQQQQALNPGQPLYAAIHGTQGVPGVTDASMMMQRSLEVGIPEAFERSQVLRSAFLGAEDGIFGNAEDQIGLGLEGTRSIFDGTPHKFPGDILVDRLDLVADEYAIALGSPTGAHSYLQWSIEHLEHTLYNRTRLAIPDTFTVGAGQNLVFDPQTNVLLNDRLQPSVPITIEHTPSSGGQLTLNPDGTGSFTAAAPGQYTFEYWLTGNVAGSNVISEPATVVILVEGSCYADCNQTGNLDIFDFLCFQDAFVQMDPYADCTGNGVFDIFDFLCFQDAFVIGCP